MKYAAIADWAADKLYPVTFMCAQLGLARQGYYPWLTQGPCQRERSDGELTEQIRTIYHQLDGNPGVRRVWAELAVQGVRVARKRVWRLMRAAGLQGRHPKPWKRTTIAGQRPIDAADLIGLDFTAEQPNTRWCGDITYVQTVDGWAYTATVIDLHSRTIVGHGVADHIRTNLIIEAFNIALCTQRPSTGVIFHQRSRLLNTPLASLPNSARSTASSDPWADAPSVTTTPSQNRSSRPTRKSSSTPVPGTMSTRFGKTHSSGSKATTIVTGVTPLSNT